ncbi:rossmann-fold nad binding domain-containing protein [Nannochloropsis oceanica]
MHASTGENDLLVVGMGTLGVFLGQAWRDALGPEATIYGETSTESRHADLRAMGVEPSVRSERATKLAQHGMAKYPHVVFCVPPSKNEDYVGEVQGALELWSGKGGFVFTSSGGVFAEDNGGTVDETAPLSTNPRMSKILEAERVVAAAGGTVMRLAGLYTQTRGPHTFWLSKGEVGATEQGIINLLHYEDAARATMAGLLHHHTIRVDNNGQNNSKNDGRILLISDDNPLTRKQICEAAVASPLFEGQYQMPIFKPSEEGKRSLGKVYDTSKSRAALGGWVPRYPSFKTFMKALNPPSAVSTASNSSGSDSVKR